MNSRVLISSIMFILFSVEVSFAETSIEAQVDQTKLSSQGFIIYKLTVTTEEKNMPSPVLPSFNDFDVVSRVQSSRISVQKGTLKTVVAYSFVLVPQKKGKLVIEPAQIKIKGKTYSTDNFEIEVKKVPYPPEPRPEPQPKPQPKKLTPGEFPSDSEKTTL